MTALDSTKLRDTAVIDKRFIGEAKAPQFDSSATIKLTENLNDKITYSYIASAPQFAVFSEVYYNHGWNAYVDGQKMPYVKTDYILRGMNVPAGKHTIEFRF